MQSNEGNLVMQDIPYAMWIFGIIFGGVGVAAGIFSKAPIFLPLIFGGIGLLLILFTPILTITVSRSSGLLTLKRTGIIQRSKREIRIDQIAEIYVKRKVSSDSDGTSTTYQINIVLDSGEEIPLRRYSSSGFRGKEKRAQQLRDAIGLDERPRPSGPFQIGRSPNRLQEAYREEQLEAVGVTEGEQVTDGVHWELQIRTFGSSPVTRWFSPDIETPDYFVYIAQKQEGQGDQKGIMNLLGKTLFKQSLKMYGFDESYTPGLDQAVIHQEADKRLMQDFFIFTSDARDAHRVLNPWVVTPLIAWADKHPLDLAGQQFSQMTVLFSPWGIYISVLGSLNAQQLEEITTLGVEIVKSSTT